MRIPLAWRAAAMCFILASPVRAQSPVFELFSDFQTTGSDPKADIGQISIVPGVKVDGPRAGMTGNTIRFQNTGSTPRVFCQPLGGKITAGQRRLTYVFDYSDAAGSISAPRNFELSLRPENLATAFLTLKIDGGTGNVSVNDVPSGNPLGTSTARTVQIDIDVDAGTSTITLDDGRPPIVQPWPSQISEFVLIDFILNTGQNADSGEAHLDSVSLVDMSQPALNWNSAVSGSWEDATQWSPQSAPTGGSAYIRTASTDSYKVGGPVNALTLVNFVIANPLGGMAELQLAQDLSVGGLNVNGGGRVSVPAGTTFNVGSSWVLTGTVAMTGGALSGAGFSNGGLLLGHGGVNASLVSNTPTGIVRAEGGTLRFSSGTIAQQGTFDCNGQVIDLAGDAALLQQGDSRLLLNGGTLRSATSLTFNSGSAAQFAGPGRLEVAGTFATNLSSAQMLLNGVDVILTGDTAFEALSEDAGTNGESLAGVQNVLNSLAVGSAALTLRSLSDNDPSVAGGSGETALYVRNLDLTGTTKDVTGGKVYYQTLTGGSDSFSNYIDINADTSPPPPAGPVNPGDGDDTPMPGGTSCGMCGSMSPAFSIVFIAGYTGLRVMRSRRRRAARPQP